MKVDGRCHCGKITYVAEIDPASVGICHCTDCQVLCGSPWRASVQTTAATFRLTGAEPTIYIKIATSGRRRRQAFCDTCGTPIYSATEHDPQTFNLRIGAIVQRAELTPKVQDWTRSRLPWAVNIADLPAGKNS
jgi:hypothetical protein